MQDYRTVILDHDDLMNKDGILKTRRLEVNGAIDALTNPTGQKVILVGHSLGAATALTLSMENKDFYNDSISTVIAFAPPVANDQDYGLTSEDWKYLNIPTLLITGTEDTIEYVGGQIQKISYMDRLQGGI